MEDGAQEGAPGEEGDTVHEHQMKRFEEISSSSITVGDMCVVCQDTGLQVAVLPCRHEYMCVGCAVRMIPMFLKGVECLQACAICREPLEALLVTRDAPASEDACNDSARTVLPRSSVSSNSQPPAADKTLLELQDPDLDTPCKPGSEDVSKRGIRKSLRESEVELQPTP